MKQVEERRFGTKGPSCSDIGDVEMVVDIKPSFLANHGENFDCNLYLQ